MRTGRSSNTDSATNIVVLTADAAFAEQARTTFGNGQIQLKVVIGTLAMSQGEGFDLADVTVVVIDLDATDPDEMTALEGLIAQVGTWPPVVVVTQAFDAALARTLVQMRVADFLVKPVSPVELARACARVSTNTAPTETNDASIYTFLPAVGGAGVTTLAISTALILLNSGQRGKTSTCLVDLNFQHGTCADYLDLEPRLNLSEIEPRPDRLDRQLLEVMLSHHPSGLAMVAAPNRPAEMRTFDPDVVTKLLDLVSSHFEYVVFDMPRTWFSWTDSVLLGSDHLYIVSEMTVPGLRHAKQLVEAIKERLGDTPRAEVIVNRFEQKMFSSGLRKGDIEQVLGDAFATCIPNHYAIVREAIDRGVPLDDVKPGNRVSAELKKLIAPQTAAKTGTAPQGLASKIKLALAR